MRATESKDYPNTSAALLSETDTAQTQGGVPLADSKSSLNGQTAAAIVVLNPAEKRDLERKLAKQISLEESEQILDG